LRSRLDVSEDLLLLFGRDTVKVGISNGLVMFYKTTAVVTKTIGPDGICYSLGGALQKSDRTNKTRLVKLLTKVVVRSCVVACLVIITQPKKNIKLR
jgi:hypothetical protein